MSFENLFMLNGVQIQDNLRGKPFSLFIEDAIQETTVSTSGISAEYGRFTGGVVNAITRSGGNSSTARFARRSPTTTGGRSARSTSRRPTTPCRPTSSRSAGRCSRQDVVLLRRPDVRPDGGEPDRYTHLRSHFDPDEKRFEGKVTQSFGPATASRRLHDDPRRGSQQRLAEPAGVMDMRSLHTRQLPQDLLSLNYAGVARPISSSKRNSRPATSRSRTPAARPRSHPRHRAALPGDRRVLVGADLLRGLQPEQRDNQNLLFKGSYFLSTGTRIAQPRLRLRHVQRPAAARQSPVRQRLPRLDDANAHRERQSYPVIAEPQHVDHLVADQRGEPGTNFRTHSLFLNDTWAVAAT